MSGFEDDNYHGAGVDILELFVEGNLLQAGNGVLKYDASKSVMSPEERSVLQRALKMVPKSMAHLEQILASDDDRLALFRFAEAVYNIGALVEVTELGPKIAGKLAGSTGGNGSAETRVAAQDAWRAEALKLALEKFGEEPEATQRNIVKHIRDNLKDRLGARSDKIGLRSDATYARAIREWRASGALPKPKRGGV